MQFYKITILLSFNGKVFFYIFIKIIVCHFIYIFAKWVILFLWHAVLHIMDMIFLENMNIIYILFAKCCPQYIRFYGCLQSYFCSVLQKSTFTIIIWMCFCILWKYICCQFCICGSFFFIEEVEVDIETIFFKLSCFSVHITNYIGWSKSSVTWRTVLLVCVLFCKMMYQNLPNQSFNLKYKFD